MSTEASPSQRGRVWFEALTGGASEAGDLRSVLIADAALGGEPARFIAVVADAGNRFPRARSGEVGIDEGWALALHVHQALAADRDGARRPIIAIVDVPSQAYGRREELLGIHLACAAAVDAYASARLAGHPVISLLVGKAMSGAFLAHGYQANRIIALDSPEVMVHAMGKQAAARVTRRSVAELEMLGETFAPMAYDIRSFARLGLLYSADLRRRCGRTAAGGCRSACARSSSARSPRCAPAAAGLARRLASPAARVSRAASIDVRRRLAEQWDAP